MVKRRRNDPKHEALRKALAPPPPDDGLRTFRLGPLRDALLKNEPGVVRICPCSTMATEDEPADIGVVDPVNCFMGVSYWRCRKCGHIFDTAPAATMPVEALSDEEMAAAFPLLQRGEDKCGEE